MTPLERIAEKLRECGRELKPAGSWLATRCPAHADTNASLGIKEDQKTGKAVVKCFAGCNDAAVLKAIGLEVRDLFPESTSPTRDVKKNEGALTLAQLAEVKKLPLEFLRSLGIADFKGGVVMPYFQTDGSSARARLRLALKGDDRFRWGFRKDRNGKEYKQVPYGLWRLKQARENGNLILVEGESDCWSGWYHNLNTLGLPGAETARLLELEHLQEIKRIYLVQEPDQGGTAFVNGVAARLKVIGWEGQAFSFAIGSGVKDLSDLHISTVGDPEIFREVVRKGVEIATPLPEPQQKSAVTPQQSPGTVDLEPVGVARTAKKAQLRNHELFTYADRNGDPREGIKAIPINNIGETLVKLTSNWPRRVDKLLFADDCGIVRYLEERDDLFAWIQSHMAVYWQAGLDDADQRSLVSRAELMSHLQASTQNYAAVEELPHEPLMRDHYYAWRQPQDYVATGEYLQQLISYFDNSETESDFHLIKAAFMTPAWGGLPGKRPAFIIMAPDRGCGKSTLANAIGAVYGGHFELQLTNSAEDKLTSRLLTPSALSKRVVRIDNIKESYDSEFIEGLITAPTISGHRLYHGDASRPNTLTFLLTGNALRLSRDIAERAFIIRLVPPKYRAGWESLVLTFIAENQQRILADIIAELKKPCQPTSADDRYADWVSFILARSCGDPEVVVALNKSRRNACDEDQDEAGIIAAAIDQHIDQIAVLDPFVFVASQQMTGVVGTALNESLTAKAVKAKLDAHIEAGRLPRVQWKRTRVQNGYAIKRPESV